MSAEKPKALSPPPRPTAVGRPVLTKTLLGHPAPSPPEVTAWLNALLKLDGKPATLIGDALNIAHGAPTVPAFPAVVDVPEAVPEDAPEELPESALEAVQETPPPPPVAEAAPPPPPPTAEAAPPSPTAIAEAPVTSAVPLEADLEDDTAIVAGGRRRRFVALALVGALALAAALIVRSRHAPAPQALPPEVVLAPAPVAVPPPAPPPDPGAHLEIGLDPPAAAPTEPAAVAVTETPAQDERPRRPHRERAVPAGGGGDHAPVQRGNALLKEGDATGAVAAFEEAVRLAPDAPDGYRGLGLARELQHKPAEAMDAFKRYIKLATRSREREWAARHLYQLAHPDETP